MKLTEQGIIEYDKLQEACRYRRNSMEQVIMICDLPHSQGAEQKKNIFCDPKNHCPLLVGTLKRKCM